MLALILLALVASSYQSDPRGFVPALDHARKTPAEWVRVLDEARGDHPDAVWSLFYADDRSSPVVEALSRWLVETRGPNARRAIDTVLVHWNVDVPLPTAREYGPMDSVPVDTLLPRPPPPQNSDESALLLDLASDHSMRACSAAAALIQRRTHVEDAFRVLLRFAPDRRERPSPEVPQTTITSPEAIRFWCEDFAGSAYARGLADMLDDAKAEYDELKWLDALLIANCDRSPALAQLEKRLNRWGGVGESARTVWSRAVGWWEEHSRGASACGVSSLHGSGPIEEPRTSAAAQESLDRVIGSRLEREIECGTIDVASLHALHAATRASIPLAERCRVLLVPLVDRQDAIGREAVCVLVHLRTKSPRVRAAYIDQMHRSARERVDHESTLCWQGHDDETLEALAAAASATDDVWTVKNALRCAGLTDARQDRLVQTTLDALASQGSLHRALSHGLRGIVAVEPSGRPVDRINALALALATRRDRGERTDDDEAAFAEVLMLPYEREGAGGYSDYVQWGFFHARQMRLTTPAVVDFAIRQVSGQVPPDGLPWSTHMDAAQAYLDVIPLGIEDAVRVAEAIPYRTELNLWQGINLASPGDGGVTSRPNAIELVPQMRLALYGGNFRVLHDLARVTRLVERDEDYLLAALERGPAQMRRALVERIDERDLAMPRTIDAVRRLRDDLDDGVARAAQDLCSTRGW